MVSLDSLSSRSMSFFILLLFYIVKRNLAIKPAQYHLYYLRYFPKCAHVYLQNCILYVKQDYIDIVLTYLVTYIEIDKSNAQLVYCNCLP